MKKRFQIKRFKFRHLFLLLTLLTFVGCVKNDLVQKDDYEAISIDDAKDAYEIRLSNSRQKSKTITDTRITDLGKYKLDWDNAVEHQFDNSSRVDVPILNQETKYMAQRLYEDNGKLLHYDVDISQRLAVVYENKGFKHTPSAYILSIIPDKLYLQKHSGDLNSVYTIDDKHDFSGFVLYHTLNGDLVSVRRYIDGVLRFNAYLPINDKEKCKRNMERVYYMLASIRVIVDNELTPVSKSSINVCPVCGKPWYSYEITDNIDTEMCTCSVDIYGNYPDYGNSGYGDSDDNYEEDYDNIEDHQNDEGMDDEACPDPNAGSGGVSGGGSNSSNLVTISTATAQVQIAMKNIGVSSKTINNLKLYHYSGVEHGESKYQYNSVTGNLEVKVYINPKIKQGSELITAVLFHEALHIAFVEMIKGIIPIPSSIQNEFTTYRNKIENRTSVTDINQIDHELMSRITDTSIDWLNSFNPSGKNGANEYIIWSGGVEEKSGFEELSETYRTFIKSKISSMNSRGK